MSEASTAFSATVVSAELEASALSAVWRLASSPSFSLFGNLAIIILLAQTKRDSFALFAFVFLNNASEYTLIQKYINILW